MLTSWGFISCIYITSWTLTVSLENVYSKLWMYCSTLLLYVPIDSNFTNYAREIKFGKKSRRDKYVSFQ